MTERELSAIKTFIGSRTELAILNLKDDPKYQAILQQQTLSGQAADEILNKLEKDERLAVQHHYEGEVQKLSHECDASYLQGIRDCLSALVFFGAFEVNCHGKQA